MVPHIDSGSSRNLHRGDKQTARRLSSATPGTIAAATVITNNGTFYTTTMRWAAQTISGVISGTGGVNQNGSGTLTLTGANTTTGTFTLNAGTVGVGNSAAFGSVSPAAVVINGGRLGNNSGTGRTIAAPVALSINADFTVDDSKFTTAANGQILFNGPLPPSAK